MILSEIIDSLGLEVRGGGSPATIEVRGGYASDLVSDVIANGQEGDLWVTLQTHHNTVAVASMKDIAAIVLVNGREPEADTIESAEKEKIPLLISALPAFELIGRLHELGLSGIRT
jgi:hypothetical protein